MGGIQGGEEGRMKEEKEKKRVKEKGSLKPRFNLRLKILS